MSTFMIADLHLGQKSVLKYNPNRGGTCLEEHNDWIVSQWNSAVGKRDVTWVLGDAAWSVKYLQLLGRMNGIKKLVRGNHDLLSTRTYLDYFNSVMGFHKNYGYWLSHCPIHPDELRGRINIHGHVHSKPLKDDRYFHVGVDALNGVPMNLEEIRDKTAMVVERMKIEHERDDGEIIW